MKHSLSVDSDTAEEPLLVLVVEVVRVGHARTVAGDGRVVVHVALGVEARTLLHLELVDFRNAVADPQRVERVLEARNPPEDDVALFFKG